MCSGSPIRCSSYANAACFQGSCAATTAVLRRHYLDSSNSTGRDRERELVGDLPGAGAECSGREAQYLTPEHRAIVSEFHGGPRTSQASESRLLPDRLGWSCLYK